MAAIEAEVTGVDGRSAKAAEVRIERQDKKMAQLVGKTDRRGRLTTTNLEVGTYKLTATVGRDPIRSARCWRTLQKARPRNASHR